LNAWLIVGLGNPGPPYADSRHNIGFRCLNHFARESGILFSAQNSLARVGQGEVAGQTVVLAKPQTFMNLSGQSVRRLVQKYPIPAERLVVVHDDMDLPVGKLRLRQNGGAGGHKGIISIITELGRPDFLRLRLGIGRPQDGANEDQFISYVLGGFEAMDRDLIEAALPRVSAALLCLITEGPDIAMTKFN
jgi:PTH1 family peptidyl-tRNA hydrolase